MRFGIAGLIIIGAVAAMRASAEPALSDSTPVPFQLIRGHIYVDGFVNGNGPYVFVFDTGASGMGRADVRLAEELGLARTGQAQNSDGVNVAPIDVVAADSLRLSGIEKRNVELLSRDYNRNRSAERPLVMGIFGADFFADHLLTIDYPASTVRFSRGELRAGEPGVFAYQDGFRIPVCFASACFQGAIDTGSNQTLVVPKDAVGKIRTSEPVLVGTGTRANTVSKMYEMQLLEPVRIGEVTAANFKIRYADPSDDEINVGSGFLKDYVLTIDSRNRLLRLEPAPAAGERG